MTTKPEPRVSHDEAREVMALLKEYSPNWCRKLAAYIHQQEQIERDVRELAEITVQPIRAQRHDTRMKELARRILDRIGRDAT